MGRLGRVLRFAGAGLVVIGLVIVAFGYWLIHRQGIAADGWEDFTGATVEFDPNGIPTITADDWLALVEAQGYVTASHRLFQMDLMRRAAGGRLAELFGPAAVEADRRRHLEDWQGVAQRGADELPANEREHCERYATGVNRFVTDNDGTWGLEYAVLDVEPAPWACSDTILIALSMAEQLSTSAAREALESRWRDGLGEAWESFLFPEDHPWNEPLFGTNPRRLELPARALPMTALEDALAHSGPVHGTTAVGSNSWAWRGPTGSFLANDPHLGANVPHLWFLLRMRVAADEWVVGASIPGLPGVILGMNPHIAWGFTNVGEDVDDYLEERLRADGTEYLVDERGGRPRWRAVEERRSTIHVKGADAVEVVGRHTHRGPLARREHLGPAEYSRQWLPLKNDAGLSRLWPIQLNRARTWAEANDAIDGFRFPAQNVLIMERGGGVGYRASGTGVRRRGSGRVPTSATIGQWAGYEPPEERHRSWLPAEEGDAFLATANQRIWVDDQGHRWGNDRRASRIREVLAGPRLTREDMERLQLDTHSRYHTIVLRWVADHTQDKSAAATKLLMRWRRWDGAAFGSGNTFAEALAVERALVDLLIAQVRRHLLGPELAKVPYRWRLRDAWVMATLSADDGIARFGLDAIEVADHLVRVATAVDGPHMIDNRWQAQHPFVGRIPVLGELFAVDEYAQWGYSSLVRVERPRFGASVRMVWDLSAPANSTWVTPVGQSGHVGSPHYRDMQRRYHRDERLRVFDTPHDWAFE